MGCGGALGGDVGVLVAVLIGVGVIEAVNVTVGVSEGKGGIGELIEVAVAV